MRGDLKTKTAVMIQEMYGLRRVKQDNQRLAAKMQKKASDLKYKASFIYKGGLQSLPLSRPDSHSVTGPEEAQRHLPEPLHISSHHAHVVP